VVKRFLKIAVVERLNGFELVHHDKTTRDLAFCLFCFARFFAVGDWGMADALVEETAERSKTLKTDFETHIRHTHVIFLTQQLLRFLNATFDQVLMRCLVKGLPEKTQEVIAREAGLFGNLIQTERMVVAVINKVTCAGQALKCLEVS